MLHMMKTRIILAKESLPFVEKHWTEKQKSRAESSGFRLKVDS